MADEITLLESFDHGRDGWRYYDTYDPDLRQTIHDQKHVDLRNFANSSVETWNNTGTVAPRPENGNLRSFRESFSTGSYSAASIRTTTPVDLVTGFASDDHFSVALPNFPLSKVNLGTSYIRLSSYTGAYEDDKAIYLYLSQSIVPLINGNSEFRVLLSSLDQGNNFDPTKVKGVNIRLATSASGVFEINAMRTLSKGWKATGLDMDTLDGSLRRVPDRRGGTTLEATQPILWHAAEPAGENDPRPIDADFVVPFQTSTANTGTNRISLYFREVTEDFMTQLDLDGMTMAELNGKAQPDIGQAKYNQRTVAELNRYKLSDLDGETVFSLERTPDFLSASWIEFSLQWGTQNKITIQDTEGNGYSFDVSPLTANTNYVFATYLQENKARAVLYLIDYFGQYVSTVFDTTLINDDTAFQRRKGRMGWYASLNDGDARILAIAPNGITYAEYRSHPYASQTPVVGAELFASNSPSNELFEEFQTGKSLFFSENAVPERDTTKSLSGESWKVTSLVDNPTAIVTQPLVITDYANSIIEFDVFVPSTITAEDIGLSARVLGQNFGETYPLITPTVYGDQWQRIRIDFLFGTPAILPGLIQVEIGLNGTPSVPTPFWIDNMSVRERTVVWDGRAVVDDPWKSNDARWQPFRDNYARDNGGIVFNKRGSNLQVRGRARKQTATISRVQYKPRYAELGRLVTPPATTTDPSFTNVITNPNGDTTTGWTNTFGNSEVYSSVTVGGKPALQSSNNSLNVSFLMTAAASPLLDYTYQYFFAAEVRKVSPRHAAACYLDFAVWSDDGTVSLAGRYANAGSGIAANNATWGEVSTYQLTNNYDLTAADDNWYTLFGLWTIDASRITAYAPLVSKTFNTPRIGLNIGFVAVDGPAPSIAQCRRATIVAIPSSVTKYPRGPFDGNSPNAKWLGTEPSASLLQPASTAPITPSFSATNAGLTATLTATAKKRVTNFEWNFGDGAKGIGSKTSHTYSSSGVYPVSLVATDAYGNQETYVNTVAV